MDAQSRFRRVMDTHLLRKTKSKISAAAWWIFRGALLFGLMFIILYPLLYMLSMTFRPTEQIYDPTVIWVPKSLTLENLKNAIELMDYPSALLVSLRINIVSALLQVAICAVTGYGFARFRFRGKNLFFMLVLVTILVPPQIIVTPLFMTFRTLNILNTAWTFYLPAVLGAGLKSGLFIFLFRQFYRGLPKELEDAAAIDGCGFFGCFLRIIIPNAGPVFITTGLLSVVWYWNDYFMSSMYLNNTDSIMTALVKLENSATQLSGGGASVDPFQIITLMQAGSLLAILPILVLYLFLQRFFVQGVERTGIVG